MNLSSSSTQVPQDNVVTTTTKVIGRGHCVKKKVTPNLRARNTVKKTSSLVTSTTTTALNNNNNNVTSTSTIKNVKDTLPVNSTSQTGKEKEGEKSLESREEGEKVTDTRKRSSCSEHGNEEETKKRKIFYDRTKAPDRSVMTMQDLIHNNPMSNPMNVKKVTTAELTVIPLVPLPSMRSDLEKSGVHFTDTRENKDDEGRLVPKLKIAPDGSIQIDETSMTVEVTNKPYANLSTTVTEDNETVTSTSFRARHKIQRWTNEETNRFYKALSQVGTDFTMMTLILPHRSRKELKNKFKREEKSNPVRITAALHKTCTPAVQATVT